MRQESGAIPQQLALLNIPPSEYSRSLQVMQLQVPDAHDQEICAAERIHIIQDHRDTESLANPVESRNRFITPFAVNPEDPSTWPEDDPPAHSNMHARQLPQRRPIDEIPPMEYPWTIAQTERILEATRLDSDFSPLWHQVLEYWFPSQGGFKIMSNWEPPSPDGTTSPSHEYGNAVGHNARSSASLAVLWSDNGWLSPLVLVQLHPTLGLPDASMHDNHSRARMKRQANSLYDRAALWSTHPNLCIISAVGSRWSAFVRSTEMTTSEEAQAVISGGATFSNGLFGSADVEWVGDWDFPVGSSVQSYVTLGDCFDLVKRGLMLEEEQQIYN